MPITATATVAPPPSHPHEILKTPKCCAASGVRFILGGAQ